LLTSRLTKYRGALERKAEEAEALKAAQEKIAHIQEAQDFLQTLAQAIQQEAHSQIARVVSKCLSAVFSTKYELLIKFVKARGKTDAQLVFRKNGYEVDPDADSGGVREIAALALRLASLVLSTPQAQKVLILDEPFRGVSDANLPKVGELIKTLSEDMGVQFLLSTHSKLLNIGKVVQL
jgi:DNA repair exonuclease SbcCD ATPase subunit